MGEADAGVLADDALRLQVALVPHQDHRDLRHSHIRRQSARLKKHQGDAFLFQSDVLVTHQN